MTASPSTPSDILKFPALVSLPEPVPAKAASPSTIFFPVLLADMSDEGLRRHSLICNRELVRRREAARCRTASPRTKPLTGQPSTRKTPPLKP
jgi:hypothetical protein